MSSTNNAINNAISGLIDLINNGPQHNSLTDFTNRNNISTRVYMEDSIANDSEIAIPIMAFLNQMYISLVMTAFNLNTYIGHGRTVRDAIGAIASESYTEVLDTIDKYFGTNDITVSTEDTSDDRMFETHDKKGASLICRKLIQLDLMLPGVCQDDRGSKRAGYVSVYITVSLYPYLLTSEVCKGFLTVNFIPSISHRWRQYRSSEISFWKDFIFASDLMKKQEKVLKEDKSGVIYEMLRNRQNRVGRMILNAITRMGTHRGDYARNVANSIIVMDKKSFDEACHTSGIKITNYGCTLQRFFDYSMSMILLVVDPMYQVCELYMNGVNQKGTYTFDMIKHSIKDKDVDLKTFMSALAQGMSPKF